MRMNNRTLRVIAATTMLTVGSNSVGCGYFLYRNDVATAARSMRGLS